MGSAARPALGLLALVGLWAAGGCKDSAPAPDAATPPPAARLVVTALTVVDGTPAALKPAGLAEAALQAIARKGLTGAGLTLDTPPADTDWRVEVAARVTYGLTDGTGLLAAEAAGSAKAHWGVEIELRPPDRPEASHVWLEGEAQAPFTPGGEALAAVLTAQATAAFAPVQSSLTARRKSLALSPVALVATLSDPSAEVRWAAVDRLAELRATSAVPALAAHAATETSREIVLRVVGALSEIGDERAAEALIGLADPRDRELLRAVVDALSVVGGERVDDFFSLLANHDAPDVRALIAQAQARRARTATPPATPPSDEEAAP